MFKAKQNVLCEQASHTPAGMHASSSQITELYLPVNQRASLAIVYTYRPSDHALSW